MTWSAQKVIEGRVARLSSAASGGTLDVERLHREVKASAAGILWIVNNPETFAEVVDDVYGFLMCHVSSGSFVTQIFAAKDKCREVLRLMTLTESTEFFKQSVSLNGILNKNMASEAIAVGISPEVVAELLLLQTTRFDSDSLAIWSLLDKAAINMALTFCARHEPDFLFYAEIGALAKAKMLNRYLSELQAEAAERVKSLACADPKQLAKLPTSKLDVLLTRVSDIRLDCLVELVLVLGVRCGGPRLSEKFVPDLAQRLLTAFNASRSVPEREALIRQFTGAFTILNGSVGRLWVDNKLADVLREELLGHGYALAKVRSKKVSYDDAVDQVRRSREALVVECNGRIHEINPLRAKEGYWLLLGVKSNPPGLRMVLPKN